MSNNKECESTGIVWATAQDELRSNDDPWAVEGAVPKADPPILQIFGNIQQGTPPNNLPPAATATGKCGFPEHSAAAMGTESTFPPAKPAAAAENSAARQLLVPKLTGPNKIEEVLEEDGDGNGGRLRSRGSWLGEIPGVEKAPCTDLRSDPTLLQNSYRTTQADAYVNHAHQTQAQSVNSQT